MNKVTRWLAGTGAAVGAILGVVAAHAQVAFPTSTASSLTADVGQQVSDPGLLLVIVLAAGIPLAFYVIHQLIGLIPKSRGRRQ